MSLAVIPPEGESTSRPHLICGVSGQVGEAVFSEAKRSGVNCVGTVSPRWNNSFRQLDIKDKEQVKSVVHELQPSVIYVCAAVSNVDYCETHPQEAYATNVTAMRNLVQAANSVDARIIFLSTDYIFDGENGPYTEESVPNPISEYGKQKLIAEKLFSDEAKSALIIRTTVVYGWEHQEKNFIARLLKDLRAGKAVNVVEDQIGSPTYNLDLAKAMLALSLTEVTGILNVVGSSVLSRYDFAVDAAQIFGLETSLINPIKTTNQITKRPLNAGLINTKAQSLLSFPLLSHQDGLKAMLASKPEVPEEIEAT